MKLTIEIEDEYYIQAFLSLATLGMLECIEKEEIAGIDTYLMLFSPSIYSIFEQSLPDLSDVLHLGSEVRTARAISSSLFTKSIEDIRNRCRDIIKHEHEKKHLNYSFDES